MKTILIVGQGIAGTVLAETFLSKGYQVIIFDEAKKSTSSLVATGVFNPIIAKRITTTWMADELLTTCNEFYISLEKQYQTKLLHHLPLYMLFENIEHQNNWSIKSTSEKYVNWVDNKKKEASPHILQPHGGEWFKGSGYVDTSLLINCFRNQQQSNLKYVNERFVMDDLIYNEESITYQNIQADYIFFCQGYEALSNSLFNYIPFKPAKGEILTIKIPNFEADYIIQSGVYILPKGNDLYVVGATYIWEELNENITEQGKSELISKVKKVIDLPFEIVDHKAGIRPAISDRRPVIGFHPQHKNIGIFNGLGAKGIMLAPYFANHLVSSMEGNSALNKEVDIQRFEAKLSSLYS